MLLACEWYFGKVLNCVNRLGQAWGSSVGCVESSVMTDVMSERCGTDGRLEDQSDFVFIKGIKTNRRR